MSVGIYKAARKIVGIDNNGKEKVFEEGEVIEGFENWPTFQALLNIKWVVIGELPKTIQPKKVEAVIKKTTLEVKEVSGNETTNFTVEDQIDESEDSEYEVIKPIKIKKAKKIANTISEDSSLVDGTDAETSTNICEHCNRSFTSKRAMSVHIKRSH